MEKRANIQAMMPDSPTKRTWYITDIFLPGMFLRMSAIGAEAHPCTLSETAETSVTWGRSLDAASSVKGSRSRRVS